MIKKFFGAILLLMIFSQNVSAEKIDRVDKEFDFHRLNRIIILDATVNPDLNFGGMVGLRGLQNTFRDTCTKTLNRDCVVYSEFAAMQVLGEQLKINLLRLSIDEPMKARELLMNNAWRLADGYIFGVVDSWGGSTYRANENVEYQETTRGKDVVPVAENYLPSETDVAAIGMVLRVYSTKDDSIVFERRELRYRQSDESQKNLFAAICQDFASDVAAKIRLNFWKGRVDMEMLEVMRARRSVRRYTEEKISDEQLKQIVSAALLAPSGHSKYPCEFIVVKNRELLEKMSHCRKGVAKMLEGAAAAVVVIADKNKSDTFVEDSCVAMMNMELLAASLGIGNCWIQVRNREAEDDSASENFLRGILNFPENFACQAILSLGYPARPPKARELDKLNFDKISWRE